MTKICTKCNIEKPLDNYSKSGNFYKSYCKLCVKEYNKLRNSLDETKEKSKQYYLDNKEHINSIQKEYNLTHKLEKKEYGKVYGSWYYNKRYKEDLNFKLRKILGIRFRDLLCKSRTNKNNSIIEILGCVIIEFKFYIESLFLSEMNWDNHGIIWELDHIIPCSNFDLTKLEEQKICFHYTNYQPLFKTTDIAESFGYKDQIGNRNKSGKII